MEAEMLHVAAGERLDFVLAAAHGIGISVAGDTHQVKQATARLIDEAHPHIPIKPPPSAQ